MPENRQLSIYIPQSNLADEPIERLMRLAEEKERSVNYLVVQAIFEYLNAEEAKDKAEGEAPPAGGSSARRGSSLDELKSTIGAAGLFKPYVAWTLRRTPDPRASATSEIAECLGEIVKVEGPIVEKRAFQLCATAAGIARIGRALAAR